MYFIFNSTFNRKQVKIPHDVSWSHIKEAILNFAIRIIRRAGYK